MATDKVQLFASSTLVGKGIERAIMTAQTNGKTVRVVKQDGRNLIYTTDFNPDRINVAVEEGKVVAITGEG